MYNRIYQIERPDDGSHRAFAIPYEVRPCSFCGSEELCRMSDNHHYPFLCVRCTAKWYRASTEQVVALFGEASGKWCKHLLTSTQRCDILTLT